MRVTRFTGIILLLSFLNSTNCDSKTFLKDFLKDFVSHENIPTTIFLFDCQSNSIVKIARATHLPIVTNPKEFLDNLLNPKSRRNDILNIVDLDCPSAKDMLSNIKPLLLAHPLRWLLLADSSSLWDHNQLLQELPLRLDSNVLIAEVFDSSRLSLKHIYRLSPSLPINHEDYGGWDLRTGIRDIRPTRILSRRRSNLHHTLLTASIVITNPDSMNHLEDYKQGHIDTISKANYCTTNILMDMLNATRKFIQTKSWGIKNQTTGKWGGMIDDMLDGRAEIGGTSLFITPERLLVVDYLSLTVSTHGAFIFRSPPLSYVANILYLPFQGYVWMCCFLLLFLCTFTYFFTWQQGQRTKENSQGEDKLRFSDAIMTSVGAITQQGTGKTSEMIPERISSFFMYLAMFFLYTSYTANIVALLQSTTTSISTLQDLLNSNMDLGVDDQIYNRYYFKTTTEPVRKAIYDKKIAPPGKQDKFMGKDEGIAKMREGLFAFFLEGSVAYKLIEETFYEHEKCGLMEIEYLQITDPWYSVPKNSPYKELIKVGLFQMKESGVERRISSKLYMKKPICSGKGQNFGSVRLIDCYMIITIIISGYILSVCIFMLEHLIKRKRFAIPESLCLF